MKKPQGFDLQKLQAWMQHVISHAGGIEAGIYSTEAQQAIPLEPDELDSVICPSKNLSSIQRLGIYGNAYFARLVECLRESFPALEYALGSELFDEFSLGYLQRYPSQSYSLCDLGDCFARHLQETRPDAEESQAGHVDWPDFLIDLAALERSIEQVFDGPGSEHESPLELAQIEEIDPARWPEMVFQPVASLRILAFRFPVNDYYTAFRQERRPQIPASREQYVALNRRDYVVRRLEVEPLEYQILAGLLRGDSLGSVITTVAHSAEMELAALADALQKWFQKWAEAQFFAGVTWRESDLI